MWIHYTENFITHNILQTTVHHPNQEYTNHKQKRKCNSVNSKIQFCFYLQFQVPWCALRHFIVSQLHSLTLSPSFNLRHLAYVGGAGGTFRKPQAKMLVSMLLRNHKHIVSLISGVPHFGFCTLQSWRWTWYVFSLEWCQGQKDLDCALAYHGNQSSKGNNRQLNYTYLATQQRTTILHM